MWGKVNQLLHCWLGIKDSFFHGLLSFWCPGMSHYGEERRRALSPDSCDLSLHCLQELLHSCLASCYVSKQVSCSVFPMSVLLWVSRSRSVAPGSASSASGNMLEIQILESIPDLLNLKLVVIPCNLCCNKPLQWFKCIPEFENHCSRSGISIVVFAQVKINVLKLFLRH